MMYAELIDLEDLAHRLRGLGIQIPAGADEVLISRELDAWLEEASAEALETATVLFTELDQQTGFVLPEVAVMVRRSRAWLARKSIDLINEKRKVAL